MQQRQLRLGDVLDDYCPRERRVTNHAVVAMVGEEVRLTRCTTCDAEHNYKHARVPRQRRKPDTPPALYAPVSASGPKRVIHDPAPLAAEEAAAPPLVEAPDEPAAPLAAQADEAIDEPADEDADDNIGNQAEGPAHRRLIRATLPRLEGQVPPSRPGPDFTIRQPAAPGRGNRFRPRHPRSGQQPFFGNGNGNGHGNGPMRAGARQPAGRGPQGLPSKRRGSGRKRSK